MYSEKFLNKLGWKICNELSGSRKIKEVYTSTGNAEKERLELLYNDSGGLILMQRFDDNGKICDGKCFD